ncbi:MAG: hypothetical protein AAFP15_16500 [Bacteroidota bacterium]
MNYTRVKASELRTNDEIVMFDELTGDPRKVALRAKKTYGGNGQYFEFYTDSECRIGFEPDTEVMRVD